MDSIEVPWNNWCRLCATPDTGQSVNIHSPTYCRQLTSENYIEINLKDALEKLFNIHSSPEEETLPHNVCDDCNSIVCSVLLFSERVERVQKMYKFLEVNMDNIFCDFDALRKKFKVFNENEGYETCSESQAYTDATAKSFKIEIRRESVESRIEEMEEPQELILVNEEHLEDEYQELEEACDSQSEDADDEANSNKYFSSASSNAVEETSKYTTTQKSVIKPLIEDFDIDLTCKCCGKDFDLYSNYCAHMETDHSDNTVVKLCPICDRQLRTWYHLGRHMRSHMPKESRFPVKCPECEKSFSSVAKLNLHINCKHLNPKKFICEICGFCATTNAALNTHMYDHNGNAPFECEICKKRFNVRYKLNSHMDIHGSNKYECTICGMQLKSRNTLRNHFAVHSEEKNHKCDYCGKGFKQTKSLKSHLILHTGIKPFGCNFCDLSFTSRTYCRRHMLKRHPAELASLEASGEKPYTENVPKLEVLRELVRTGDGLNAIAIRKTDDGNLKCLFCERMFRHRAGRNLHMKTKHADDFEAKKNAKRIIKSAESTAVTCEFCNRKFGHQKLYQNHLKRVHPDEALDTVNNISTHESIAEEESNIDLLA